LRELEFRELRKIFDPKRKKLQDTGEDCIVRSLMICTPHQSLRLQNEGRDEPGMWHAWGRKDVFLYRF
jgi:hypothetical protein